MKKFLLVLLSTATLLTGTVLTSPPASAAVFPNGGNVYYTVGDNVRLDLGCQESNITSVTLRAGLFPDGLSMDSQGVVTGIPTTVGDYTLSNYFCSFGGGGVGFSLWYITFHIAPMTTPAPVLVAHNLNTNDCQFYLGFLFPQTPDTNSTSIRIENQAGTVYVENASNGFYGNAGEFKEIAAPVDNLNTWPLGQGFSGSFTGTQPFACGDTLSITLSYQWRGAPAGSTTVNGVTLSKPVAELTPVLNAYQVVGQQCSVNVTYPLTDVDTGVNLRLRKDGNIEADASMYFNETNGISGGLKATLSLNKQADMKANALLGDLLVSNADCSGDWFVDLYGNGGNLVAETPVTLVAQPVASTVFVRAVALNDNSCQFKVLTSLPDKALPNSTQLTFNVTGASTNRIVAHFSDNVLGNVLELTVLADRIVYSIDGMTEVASYEVNLNGGIGCNNIIDLKLEYDDLSGNHKVFNTSVTPTRPTIFNSSDYSITAYPSGTVGCAITVKVTAPDVSRPLTVAITEPNSNENISSIYYTGGTTIDGTFTATLSLTNYAGFSTSLPATDFDLSPGSPCDGEYRAVLVTNQGIVASDTTYLPRTPTKCGAGYVITEDRLDCDAVPRGYYTTTYNATVATACPAGMTTQGTGSKSPNDCYKPIVQTIAGLTAPKAIKFKASINLPLITNAGEAAQYRASGPCTVTLANVTTSVKGKKVTTKMLKVTGGSKAGICQIFLVSPEVGKYAALSKAISIKVSKTGK